MARLDQSNGSVPRRLRQRCSRGGAPAVDLEGRRASSREGRQRARRPGGASTRARATRKPRVRGAPRATPPLLYASYTDRHERDALVRALIERLALERAAPMVGDGPGALRGVGAHRRSSSGCCAHAADGQRAYPELDGRRRSAPRSSPSSMRPTTSMATMRVDGANKPSIMVESRNLRRLYLRAYARRRARALGDVEGLQPLSRARTSCTAC